MLAGACASGDGGDSRDRSGAGASVPEGVVVRGAPAPAGFVALPGRVERDVGVNWAVFAEASMWTHGQDQYVVWVDGAGAPIIGRRDVGSGTALPGGAGWETFDLSSLPGNPLGAPVDADAHNVFAVAVDADGFVHVTGNMHSSALRYLRSTEPRSITSWDEGAMVGSAETQVTYPVFVTGPGGELLFFYRSGTSRSGRLVLNALTGRSDRSRSWERVGVILADSARGVAPYPNHIVVADGVIHVMHVWRTGPGAEANRVVAYVASRDGGRSWVNGDGDPVAVPVGVGASTEVAVVPGDLVVVNSGGAAVDAAGNPVAVFRSRSRSGGGGGLWMVSRVEGRWSAGQVPGTSGASGRAVLVRFGDRLVLVWPTAAGTDETGVSAADVTDGNAADDGRPLLIVPVDAWEPVLDRVRVGRGVLDLVVPVPGSEPTGSRSGGPAGIVTYQAGQLVSGRRRHRRAGAGCSPAAQRTSSSASASPRSIIAAPASAMNTSRCSELQCCHACSPGPSSAT